MIDFKQGGYRSATTIRMDDDLKAQVNALLDSMGLSFNTFVNMASIQLVSQRRIPFEIKEPAPALPTAGHASTNGVVYEGLDERGYPKVTVPGIIGARPGTCRRRGNDSSQGMAR